MFLFYVFFSIPIIVFTKASNFQMASQPPPAFPRNENPFMSPISGTSVITSASTLSMSSENPTIASIEAGYPVTQYLYIDPDNQYQQYLSVLVQTLSGTDPMDPPAYNPFLIEGGKKLRIKVPISPVLANTDLLVNKKVSWMKGGGYYPNKRQTRLGGLGPAIAQISSHFQGQQWFTTWNIPLAKPCDEVVGNYSICNFPSQPNRHGQHYYPVVIEFKLKTLQQSVRTSQTVNTGVWDLCSSSEEDDYDLSYKSPTKKPKTKDD